MRLTPLDIRNHRFSTRVRGHDAAEVEAFLLLISEDYEELIRESEAILEHDRHRRGHHLTSGG